MSVLDDVTTALRDHRIQLGPRTISLIQSGAWQSICLSLNDIRDITWLLQEAGLLPPDTENP